MNSSNNSQETPEQYEGATEEEIDTHYAWEKIEINGIGENLWVNASETKPLTFEENLEFAAEVMQRCLTARRLVT